MSSTESSIASAGEFQDRTTASESHKEVMLVWRDLCVTVEKKLPKSSLWSKQGVEHQTILDNGKKTCFFFVFFTLSRFQ